MRDVCLCFPKGLERKFREQASSPPPATTRYAASYVYCQTLLTGKTTQPGGTASSRTHARPEQEDSYTQATPQVTRPSHPYSHPGTRGGESQTYDAGKTQ
ncbi:hypothetical protein E2C01_078323 [Portunus trituberculatus]|uniref:Uncharacterized protein n=1 Tax=Portunus trituberculatus TaxID=210409 RepID=A0A5B7IGQ1_PORTR|nr:hypothetical protein [Portunus trituberculatus]